MKTGTMMTCWSGRGMGMAGAFILLMALLSARADESNDAAHSLPNLPNLPGGQSAERVWGIGASNPYPYYQRPRYRYPVYDNQGNGKFVYGYGGKETFNYTSFNPNEGHY